MSRNDLTAFLSKNYLKVNTDPPDVIIPKLLQMTVKYQGKQVQKEVFIMLTAYHLRNYAGHNIAQQNVLTTQYDEIVKQLFTALFLAIDSL